MDVAAYTILLTAATVAALILATLFFFGRGASSTSREAAPEEQAPPKKNELGVPEASVRLAPTGSDDSFDEIPTLPAEGQITGEAAKPAQSSCEDAAGPIWPAVQPASDEDIWKVWFDQPNQSKSMSKGQFEDSMKVLGTFNTMADFWEKYSNLMHEKLPTKSNVRVFQSNVRPLWEDAVNRDGGKWIVVVPKPKSVGVFNEVLAAMVSNKFNCEISGLVLSKKVREDLVSVWTPSGLSIPSLEDLRDTIGELLELHLGLKPEITFMSHDKKNKISIAGKGEKKEKDKKESAQAAAGQGKSRFTGMKPARGRSPDGNRRSSRPVSPPHAPGRGCKSAELRPRPVRERPPPGPPAPRSTMAAAMPERSRDNAVQPVTKLLPPREQSSDDDETQAEPDGWEVVRSKSAKNKNKDNRKRFVSL